MTRMAMTAAALAALLAFPPAVAGAQTDPAPVPPALPVQLPRAVPPMPPQPVAQFFFDGGGQPVGPLSLAEIGAKIAAGAIKPETLVWKTGASGWVAAKELPEVAGLLTPRIDPKTFFVGTWEIQAPGPEGTTGPSTFTLTCAADGTLSGSYNFVLAATNAPASVALAGTWKVDGIEGKRFTLTTVLRMQIGGETKTSTTVSHLEIVDDNTLRDLDYGTLARRVGR